MIFRIDKYAEDDRLGMLCGSGPGHLFPVYLQTLMNGKQQLCIELHEYDEERYDYVRPIRDWFDSNKSWLNQLGVVSYTTSARNVSVVEDYEPHGPSFGFQHIQQMLEIHAFMESLLFLNSTLVLDPRKQEIKITTFGNRVTQAETIVSVSFKPEEKLLVLQRLQKILAFIFHKQELNVVSGLQCCGPRIFNDGRMSGYVCFNRLRPAGNRHQRQKFLRFYQGLFTAAATLDNHDVAMQALEDGLRAGNNRWAKQAVNTKPFEVLCDRLAAMNKPEATKASLS